MFIKSLDDTKVNSKENVTEGFLRLIAAWMQGLREDSEELSLGNVKFENACETSKCRC